MTGEHDPSAELRLRPGWWARLAGDPFDLNELALALQDPSPVEVLSLDGGYYLRTDEFDEFNEPNLVEIRANELLRILNGAARVEHGDNGEIHVDGVACVGATGEIQYFIHARSELHLRARLSTAATVGGEHHPVAPEASITEQAMKLALDDLQAQRALRIFGRKDADYRDLYHVFEIAEAVLGDSLYSDGTVTNAEVRRFKHTANSVQALGDQARHGHETTRPPSKPTTLSDAQALVGRVLRAWLANVGRDRV